MKDVVFHRLAFDQYSEWALTDKKLFRRIQRIIVETSRDAFSGIGKPQPLRGKLSGFWSRRIDENHRLVYQITESQIIIASCKNHYP